MSGVTIAEARAAKSRLTGMLESNDGVRGIGLTRCGEGYAVKVNVASTTVEATIPSSLDGVPIVIDIVGRAEAL